MFIAFLVVVLLAVLVVKSISSQDTEYQIRALRQRVEMLETQVRQLMGGGAPQKAAPAIFKEVEPLPPPATSSPKPYVSATSVKPVVPKSYQVPVKSWSAPKIDWENFMGVKLFAWLGGFALFLGVAFFVKYSVDHNLISPLARVIIGFIAGIGTIIGGLSMRKKGYAVTVQTLCAAGIAILYADTYACRSFYQFLSNEVAFVFMILVTVTSFLLAVRLESRYVAILGLVGGFLTPVLLSTGVDRPITLFSYIALLDAGVIAVALRKRWGFLMSLSAGATFLMQLGWVAKFFMPVKGELAVGIFLFFCLFYLIAEKMASHRGIKDEHFLVPAAVLPLACMGFVAYMFTFNSLAVRPGLVLSFLLALNAHLAYLAVCRDDSRTAYVLGGLATFALLSFWTVEHLKSGLLLWGLGYYMAFAVLHTALPIILARLRPTQSPFLWGYAAPILMLVLILLAMVFCDILSFVMWPFVLLLGMLAISVAWLAASIWAAFATVGLVMLAFAIWLFRLPDVAGLPGILTLLAFFSCGFFAWGLLVTRGKSLFKGNAILSSANRILPEDAALLPALSAFMPFMLIAMVCMKLRMPNPTDVFGLMLLMTVLLLGLERYRQVEALSWVALISVGMIEWVWHVQSFTPGQAIVPVAWYLGFYAVFLIFPFLNRMHLKGTSAWGAAAMVGPMQFWFVYRVVTQTLGKDSIGLIPALFAIAPLLALAHIQAAFPKTDSQKLSLQAWFGGVALFFITLIIPVQFDKEWITLGWALEGAALLWLYHRVPHEGLKTWGLALLGISFVRLAMNPAVFSYHPRTDVAIFNWYLAVYGAAAASLFAGAKLLAPPRQMFMETNTPPVLNTLGAILLFLLLNIEIADYFSKGATITFQFSGNIAQDMTYSLAWALFAIVTLMIGIRAKSQGTRYASLGLLVLTIFKVFLHDLWRLGQLFRVGSFVGLAVILILVSFLYQKYVASQKPSEVRRA